MTGPAGGQWVELLPGPAYNRGRCGVCSEPTSSGWAYWIGNTVHAVCCSGCVEVLLDTEEPVVDTCR